MERISKVEWTRTLVYKLIEMWKGFQFLYNPTQNNYHNKRARNDAINEIKRALEEITPNVTATDIKMKINYLRGQYTRELSKVRESAAANDSELYVPSPFWYEKLDFLLDYVKVRKSGPGENKMRFYSSQPVSADSYSEQYSDNEEMNENGNASVKTIKRPRYTNESSSYNESSTMYETTNNELVETSPSIKGRLRTREEVINEDFLDQEYINDREEECKQENIQADVLDMDSSYANGSHFNGRLELDEAFANFIKAELSTITNENIRDNLIEKITMSLFEAKRKQKRRMESSC